MRTTVTLDPDVEALIRKIMRERGLTFKEALNSGLRAGLSGGLGGPGQPFQQKTFAMGFRPELGLDRALSLASDLEDDEITRKLNLRK